MAGYKYSFPESYRIVGGAQSDSNDGITDEQAYRGTTESGEGQAFNVVQPSKVVFIWCRTS